MYEDGPNFRQSGDERRSRRIPLVVEIWDVVVREVVVSSTLVVAGVLTVVTLVVISVVVNSGSSEYFARYFGSNVLRATVTVMIFRLTVMSKFNLSDFYYYYLFI